MKTRIIPCLRYRDAPKMIDWLRGAFGFDLWSFGSYDTWA